MGLQCAGRLVWWQCSSIRAREFLTSILGRTLLAPTLRFAVGQLSASSPLRASSWHPNFCTTRQQTYHQSARTCFRCPCRLVVRTSRRGRDNPGSNPGKDILRHRAPLRIAFNILSSPLRQLLKRVAPHCRLIDAGVRVVYGDGVKPRQSSLCGLPSHSGIRSQSPSAAPDANIAACTLRRRGHAGSCISRDHTLSLHTSVKERQSCGLKILEPDRQSNNQARGQHAHPFPPPSPALPFPTAHPIPTSPHPLSSRRWKAKMLGGWWAVSARR